MNPRFLLRACIVGLVFLCSCAATPAKPVLPPRPQRVLFIGNSYTFFNGGVDNALNRLSKGDLVCSSETSGGKSLAWHYTQSDARQKIAASAWDFVVLQDYSLQPLDKPDMLSLFVGKFCDEIAKVHAKPVLFMTWPRENRPEDGPEIYDAYENAAGDNHALVAPVGLAWKMVRGQRPKLALYREDRSHPTPAGTYLAACVFYDVLLDRSCAGLDAWVTDAKGHPLITLDPRDAALLQQVADECVHPALPSTRAGNR